jgi:hypothetical protein
VMNSNNYDKPEPLTVQEFSLSLGVSSSKVYHWMYSGIVEAQRISFFSPLMDVLRGKGVYKARNLAGSIISTKTVRWVIPIQELEWLAELKNKNPNIFQKRLPRGMLRNYILGFINTVGGK